MCLEPPDKYFQIFPNYSKLFKIISQRETGVCNLLTNFSPSLLNQSLKNHNRSEYKTQGLDCRAPEILLLRRRERREKRQIESRSQKLPSSFCSPKPFQGLSVIVGIDDLVLNGQLNSLWTHPFPQLLLVPCA